MRVNFTQAVQSVLGKYATFSGRARRSEYWYWSLALLIAFVVLRLLGAISSAFIIIYAIVALGVLVPGLAVLWRRLHDTGRSGWWVLIGLVPLVGVIVLIVFLATDGTPTENKYGPSPKATPGSPYGTAPSY